jgi:hypothetical protein
MLSDDYPAELSARLAQFETLVEATAPPPVNRCTCQCLRCVESRGRRSAA